MNILIDIGHPGHVHLFKNLYFELKQRGHNVWVTVKDISVAKNLLLAYKIPFINLGRKSDNLILKIFGQVIYDLKIWNLVRKYNIELGIGTSVSIANVSFFSKMKSIITDDDDDDVQPLFVNSAHRFANILLSPDSLWTKRKRKKHTIFYPGLHELAYLHPNRFSPDPSLLKELNIYNKDYFILRFNAFKAHHDIGAKGLSIDQKLELIKLLEPYGQVFITSEQEASCEFEKYKLLLSSENIHSLLCSARLFIGDSQTMASEAAVLGTPSIRCNSFVGRIAYLEEEEIKYGLTFGFRPEQFEEMKLKIHELLSMENIKEEWRKRQMHLIHDKIDTTNFFLYIIENYKDINYKEFSSEFFNTFKL